VAVRRARGQAVLVCRVAPSERPAEHTAIVCWSTLWHSVPGHASAVAAAHAVSDMMCCSVQRWQYRR
jgi:hypothetical protein